MIWWKDPRIEPVIQAYQALSERERILTQVTLHFILAGIVGFILLEPLYSRAMENRSATMLMTGENKLLEGQLTALQNEPVKDPNQALNDAIEKLRAEQKNIQLRISNLTDALVSPENMVVVLEQMLKQDQRLKITRLETIPKKEIKLEKNSDDARLFRHGLRITVTSSYPGLVDYLKRLDALKWRLYWQMLKYKVSRYPKGELTLEVYTLSTREEVIGA